MPTALPLVKTGTVRGACPHDCPDTCAIITTVEEGRAVRIQGDPDHPVTQGFLCSKVNRYIERTYHHDRLTHPLTANPHLWPFVLAAREKGATVICIDPIRTRTARQCDEWIPIRPGTD